MRCRVAERHERAGLVGTSRGASRHRSRARRRARDAFASSTSAIAIAASRRSSSRASRGSARTSAASAVTCAAPHRDDRGAPRDAIRAADRFACTAVISALVASIRAGSDAGVRAIRGAAARARHARRAARLRRRAAARHRRSTRSRGRLPPIARGDQRRCARSSSERSSRAARSGDASAITPRTARSKSASPLRRRRELDATAIDDELDLRPPRHHVERMRPADARDSRRGIPPARLSCSATALRYAGRGRPGSTAPAPRGAGREMLEPPREAARLAGPHAASTRRRARARRARATEWATGPQGQAPGKVLCRASSRACIRDAGAPGSTARSPRSPADRAADPDRSVDSAAPSARSRAAVEVVVTIRPTRSRSGPLWYASPRSGRCRRGPTASCRGRRPIEQWPRHCCLSCSADFFASSPPSTAGHRARQSARRRRAPPPRTPLRASEACRARASRSAPAAGTPCAFQSRTRARPRRSCRTPARRRATTARAAAARRRGRPCSRRAGHRHPPASTPSAPSGIASTPLTYSVTPPVAARMMRDGMPPRPSGDNPNAVTGCAVPAASAPSVDVENRADVAILARVDNRLLPQLLGQAARRRDELSLR